MKLYYTYKEYDYGVVKIERDKSRLLTQCMDWNSEPEWVTMDWFQEMIEAGEIEVTMEPPKTDDAT